MYNTILQILTLAIHLAQRFLDLLHTEIWLSTGTLRFSDGVKMILQKFEYELQNWLEDPGSFP